MSQNYLEMENKELLKIVEEKEIEVEAKNPRKPNKAELVDAINAFDAQESILNGTSNKVSDEELDAQLIDNKKEVKKDNKAAPKNNTLSRAARARLQRADLLRKELVIIHDTRNSQTKSKAEFVKWGNGLIGIHTDIVNLNSNKGQYVRRGALANLRNVIITEYTQDDERNEPVSSTRPRFSIIPLAGLTEEEIKVKADQQKMRNAGIAVPN